jgi:hypothetical protein
MPTNFPGSLDTTTQLPTTRADGSTMATNHAADHDNVNAAAVAVETKLGLGSTTPTAGLYLRGTATGSAWQNANFAAKTTTYSAVVGDDILTADATGAAFTITLPSAVTAGAGWDLTIIRINSGANNVTIATVSSQTISGAASYVLTVQWGAVTLVSNGTNWLAV